ncbi:MAG TPA: hypothetical protein VHK27_14900 [Gammaproteobacteria bacterium]|nr:hypothetical protein [Gammaproteobacteria bacterium]
MARVLFRRTTTLLLTALNAILPAYLMFAPNTASAQDFTIRPRINTGVMYYNLDVENSIDVNDTLPFIGGGVTTFIDRVYVDLYAQGAFSGSDDIQQIQGTNVPGVTLDWDRAEYSASVGYSVMDNFSIFAGYRHSDTEFDVGNSSLFDYENDGPFVGVNYGLLINRLNGTLSFNIAAARFDGEISFAPDARIPAVTGDTVSFTAGVTWIGNLLRGTGSGLFAHGLNYTIGVDGYSYNFTQDNVPENISGNEISETVIRGSVGLSIPFNL